jgi:hypothetical protein
MRRVFTSRANVQNGVETFDSYNEPSIVWQDDPLLVQLPCYVEPASGNGSGGETRKPGNTLVTGLWNCVIAGYYPNITNEQQIVVDGITYNINDTSLESTDTITVLVLERVSV